MDKEEFKRQLHPEIESEKRSKELERKYGAAIKVAVVMLIIIIILTAVSIITAPKKIIGTPQACFKHDMCFNLAIARTPQEQETGLSNYTTLDKDAAMLFIFEKPEIIRMWMKDMKFPIDMFWLDTNNRIVHIEKSVEPCRPNDCPVYEPEYQAIYVIETRAGFAKDNNQFDGDTVELKNIP